MIRVTVGGDQDLDRFTDELLGVGAEQLGTGRRRAPARTAPRRHPLGKSVRNTIFRLPGRTDSARGLRDEMFRVGDKFAEELGFTPRFAFQSPVDAAVPETATEHLLQVLTEGLSNIARHARATSAEAIVDVEDGWLTLSLLDDGVGIADGPSAGLGLSNMSGRATSLGGSCTAYPRIPNGTSLVWRVPI